MKDIVEIYSIHRYAKLHGLLKMSRDRFILVFLHKYKVITGTINVLVFYSSGDIAQVVEQ